MNPVGVVGCFMFVLVMLALGAIYSRIHWMLKALLVVSTLGFCGMFYETYFGALGWPVKVHPHGIQRLVWAEVRDPVPPKHDPGAIYLWLIDPHGSSLPRAYELPFSRDARKVVGEAKETIKKHAKAYLNFDGPKGEAKAKGNDQQNNSVSRADKSDGGKDDSPYQDRGQAIEIVHPKDTLPQKDDIGQ